MRETLSTNKDILLKMEQWEKNMIKQDGKQVKNEEDIQIIFKALKKLFNPPPQPGERIGFKP